MKVFATLLALFLVGYYAHRVVRFMRRTSPRNRLNLGQLTLIWGGACLAYISMGYAIWL